MKRIASVFVLGMLLAGRAQAVENIVLNPSFTEGGRNWTEYTWFSGGTVFSPVLYSRDAHSGAASSLCTFGCLGGEAGKGVYFGQALSTTAGNVYDLSFWARTEDVNSWMTVYWDGKAVSPKVLKFANKDWTEFSFHNLKAVDNSTFLEIHSLNPSITRTFYDQFNVSAVPEPGAGTMLATGLAALGFVRYQRRRKFE